MVYGFSKVEFYSTLKVGNTVYTENGIHKAPPQPTPDSSQFIGSVDNVVPKSSQVYSIMEIDRPLMADQVSKKDLMEPGSQPSFVRLLFVNTYIFGWIDDIKMKIHSTVGFSYIVRWHVDWYLTLGNSVYYGSGRLLRGPAAYARPDSSEPRLWLESGHVQIGSPTPGKGTWIVVYYTSERTVGNNTYTIFNLAFWQPDGTINVGGTDYPTISTKYTYYGVLEELLGLDPDSIVGVYISPIPPAPVSSSTVSSNVVTAALDGAHAFYTMRSGYCEPFTATIIPAKKTTDSEKIVIVDPNGAIQATIPWGLEFNGYSAVLDIGPSGAFLIIRLTLTNYAPTPYSIGATEGRMLSIPLITAPVTSNAWASYTYSGEREYDQESKRLQQQQNALSGISGVGTSIIGGAVAGSIAPGVGTAAGAVAGAATGIMSTALGYTIGTSYDRKAQEAVDKFKSNQTAQVIVTSGGCAWNTATCPGRWEFITMTRDSVSAAELTTEQAELGYLTDTQLADATTIIGGKGPLRIEGLQVYGICPEGCRYISDMFARGVYLD